MAKRHKIETQEQDLEQQKRLEETQNEFNRLISQTYQRVMTEYGESGIRMAQSANSLADSPEFVSFFYHFFNTARLHSKNRKEKSEVYTQAMNMGIFLNKLDFHYPWNDVSPVQERLERDTDLQVFISELFTTIYNEYSPSCSS